MILEKVKTNIVTILVCIAAILTIIEQLWKGRMGVKMILDLFPAKIETFWLLMTIFAMILLLVNYERIPLLGRKYKEYKKEVTTLKTNSENEKKTLQSEIEDTEKHLGSELEKKEKQYNELYEKTKPPYSVDKLIKAEANYNPIGRVGIEGKPPYLIFDIRVINRTNYYFTPKKVFLACYHGKDLVFKEDWEERAKTPHIIISELQRLGDGSIQFHVPKEKIENNMGELTLKKGYVEYATEEEIIHDTGRKSVKVNITKLEYTLDEKTASEPKGRVLIAK